MRQFLCCSVLVLSFSLNASNKAVANTADSAAVVGAGTDIIEFMPSATDHSGAFIGIGLNVGKQKTDVGINDEFEGRQSSFSPTIYGGTIAIGYNHNIIGTNFSVGVETGADFGQISKRAILGGRFRNDSQLLLCYQRDYSLKEEAVYTSIEQITEKMTDAVNTGIDQNAYANFVLTMRYLGGANGYNVTDFMTNEHAVGGINNAGANFIDFIGNVAYNRIKNLGNNDISAGYSVVREFVAENYPNFAHVLSHISERHMVLLTQHDHGANHNNTVSPAVAENGVFRAGYVFQGGHVAGVIAALFDGQTPRDVTIRYENLGITNQNGNDHDLINENILDDINNKIYISDNSTVTPRLTATELSKLTNLKSKATFGICPYLALKFGYFIPEIRSNIYVKTGFMQLHGNVVAVNDFIEVKEDFSKVAAFLGIGFSKMINKKCGIALEYTQTLKVKKKFKDIEYYGYKIKNNATLSKVNVRILLTYNL